jgi:hypothetical protein
MASRWENDDQRTTDVCPHLTACKYSAITCLAAAVAPRRRGRIQHAHAGPGTAPAAAVLALPQLPEFCTASRAPPNGQQPPCTNKAATSWQGTCAVDGATTAASIDSLSCYCTMQVPLHHVVVILTHCYRHSCQQSCATGYGSRR